MITEDAIVNWVKKENGLLHTRKYSNIYELDNYLNRENLLVCLTGYPQIIEYFFNKEISKFKHPVVLITLETDRFPMKGVYLDSPNLKHWFTWNKPFEHPKVSALPIALNHDRHVEMITKFLDKKTVYAPNKLLLVNFDVKTNPVRYELLRKGLKEWKAFADTNAYLKEDKFYFTDSIIDRKLGVKVVNKGYYDLISQYKFVLSPPGAGVDCHRTWEALYVGCIPVVIKSSISELYEGLPVLVVDSWDDINEDFLNKKWEEMSKIEYDKSKLTLEYWYDKIQSKSGKKKKKRKIHFMTYANEKFANAKKRILQQAKEFGEFSIIKGYGPEDLPHHFKEKYKHILDRDRGGGYWLWRPIILLDALEEVGEGEFLVYLDAGCTLNPLGKKRFNEYISLLDKSEYGILSFQMSGNKGPGSLEMEKKWTIREIFEYFGVNPQSNIGTSGQYLGGVFIMQKNKHLEEYMTKLLAAIEYDPLMCTDDYNKKNQIDEFRANRHEQSISSVLRKKIGSVVIDGDESWMQPFGRGKSLNYPFWATRSKR